MYYRFDVVPNLATGNPGGPSAARNFRVSQKLEGCQRRVLKVSAVLGAAIELMM